MESRQFIRVATQLVTRIKDVALVSSIGEGDPGAREDTQKLISAAFSGLQNPTLPSAFKLRDAATEHGYSINPTVLHALHRGEACWG